MSASFYDLLKYAATGIASPSMTYYDKMRASTLMGATVRTLTGQPPLTFKADGTPLISWSMLGNGQQTDTPTPDNIIMPTLCGVRTGNLWSEDYPEISGTAKYVPVKVGNGEFTLSSTVSKSGSGVGAAAVLFLLAGNVSSGISTDNNGVWDGQSRTVNAIDGYVTVAYRIYTSANPVDSSTMLNLGRTALPYEPFGWAAKITCAGQTVPVYLGQTQTVRRIKKLVLTGEENITQVSGNAKWKVPVSDMMIPNTDEVLWACSHYQGVPNISIWSDYDYAISFSTADRTEPALRIRDINYFTGATLNNYKQYLAAQYANGTPVTIWYVLSASATETTISNEPLCKIGAYADELSSEDAAVTIPTAKGQNTLTVDTPIQPSEMTITYKG